MGIGGEAPREIKKKEPKMKEKSLDEINLRPSLKLSCMHLPVNTLVYFIVSSGSED